MKSSIKTLVATLLGTCAVTGCTALLGSFEVTGGGQDLPDGQSTADGSNVGPDGSVGDASTDTTVPLVCTLPEVACNNVCTRLETSGDHCGKCGHSCGGGVCARATCAPAKLHDGPLLVGPIGVGDSDLFFATELAADQHKVSVCPKSGCKVAPKQVALMQYKVATLTVVQKNIVVFESAPVQTTQRPALYACTANGCASPPVAFTSDGLNGFEPRLGSFGDRVFYNAGGSGLSWSACTAGACGAPNRLGPSTRGTSAFSSSLTNMYFVDKASLTIATCEQKDTACVPKTVVAGDQTDVLTTVVDAGRLFWLKPGRDGFNEGKLLSCDLPLCPTVKTVAVGLDSPTELLVDASGAYWLTKGEKLQRCAPNGCAGGPQDFAGPLASPHSIVADPAFVYWAEKAAIWRLAK